jgi:hypothetical protein
MALIDKVFTLCKEKLVGNAWDTLLKEGHGLDINQSTAAKLADVLLNQELSINRKIPGFEDFAADRARGIVPLRPAHSLLYHAVASPNVVAGIDGKPLPDFLTLDEIEIVENYIFGVKPPTIDELHSRAGSNPLTVVVFAYEYRPASQSCHRKHADLVFSRTGIARVGTRPARYVGALRGYVPEAEDSPFVIHVSPARYAAFLAVKQPGSEAAFVPMRFRKERDKEADPDDWQPDDRRGFWVPVHKLFPGSECLLRAPGQSFTLSLEFQARHINEKLFRLHRELGNSPPDRSPYRIRDNPIAVLASCENGSASVLPTAHDTLIEEAWLSRNRRLTFMVPKTGGGPGSKKHFSTLSTSLSFDQPSAPSYVHVRTEIRAGVPVNLNEDDPSLHTDETLLSKVLRGGYEAQNYVDYTGEGWVTVACDELKGAAGVDANARAAYSLVAAPDFYPGCDQRELTEWTGSSSVPPAIRSEIWNVLPRTLCDTRISPNLQLPDNPFVKEETITALVPLLGPSPAGSEIASPASVRHTHLPDDAAGEFAPGWDVSSDALKDGTPHLAGYGLGSPFPEDAKLCAALSTFWPAVAPDATREMEPYRWPNPPPSPGLGEVNQSGTVSPMTDHEIAQIGDLPWDGVRGPQVITKQGQSFVEYANFHRVDYVRNALAGLFTIRLTARVDAPEYQRRVLALAFVYMALHIEVKKEPLKKGQLPAWRKSWKVLSFQFMAGGTPELAQAQQDAETLLPADVYRCVLFPAGKVLDADDFRKKRVALRDRFFFFVDPSHAFVLLKREGELKWRKGAGTGGPR